MCAGRKKKIKKSGRRQDWVKDKGARKKSEKRREKNISAKKGKIFFWGGKRERGGREGKNLITIYLKSSCGYKAHFAQNRREHTARGDRDAHMKRGVTLNVPAPPGSLSLCRLFCRRSFLPKSTQRPKPRRRRRIRWPRGRSSSTSRQRASTRQLCRRF